MKAIITLVVAVLSFNLTAAETLHGVDTKTRYYSAEETEFFQPSDVLTPYAKSELDVIIENNKIIGDGDGELTAVPRSMEEIIAADLQITEASMPEYAPLTVETTSGIGFCKTNLLLN